MSTATTFTADQAKAHDALVAEAAGALRAAADRVQARALDVRRAAGDEEIGRGRSKRRKFTMSEATERARRIAAGNIPDDMANAPAWRLRNAADRAGAAIQALAIADEDRDEKRAAFDALEDVWRRAGRWSRFFLVPGGHIHSGTHCRTLHPTTRVGWLPNLSGETEADAVAEHGPLLCSVCFPSAPVEWTIGPKAEVDPDQCEGGYSRDANLRRCSPRGTCPKCGANVSVTSTGKTRKHKVGA